MQKDFDEWNRRKKNLEGRIPNVLFYERELWWCSIGINIGHEENGKGIDFARPVVIFKKLNQETFWGISVTTVITEQKFRVSIDVGDAIQRQAKISQLRLYDTRRLIGKIGMVSVSDYWFIRKAVTDVSTS